MANDILNPYQQFLDDAGNPLSAGTLTFYDNKTTTVNTAVYSDSDLSVTSVDVNGVYTLDASGRTRADVKYNGVRTIYVKNANGGLVRVLDNVVSTSGGSGIEVYEYGYGTSGAGTASAASHPGIATGTLIKTSYHDSDQVNNSGGEFKFTGTTTVGNASDWPNADGFFYDADGRQFKLQDDHWIQKFGAKADGTNNDSPACNAANQSKSDSGGGEVLYPAGTILLERDITEARGTAYDQYMCIWALDYIHQKGRGPTATKLLIKANTDAHCFFKRDAIEVEISGFEIDGNRDNQPVQNPSTGNEPAGILLVTTAWKCHLHDLYIHDTPDYAIGFEGKMSAQSCTVERVDILDPGSDGIDMKNAGADGAPPASVPSWGNVCRDIRILGLKSTIGNGGASNEIAGVNPRGGWNLYNITVTDLELNESGVRFASGEYGDNNGVGGHDNVIDGLYVQSGTLIQNTKALVVGGRNNRISNVYVVGTSTPISLTSSGGVYNNLVLKDFKTVGLKVNTGGIDLTDNNLFTNVRCSDGTDAASIGIYIVDGERNNFSNFTVEGCNDGLLCEGDYNQFNNGLALSNDNDGFQFHADYLSVNNCVGESNWQNFSFAGDYCRLTGGASRTPLVIAPGNYIGIGASNYLVVTGVEGIANEVQVLSGAFDLTSTAAQDLVIPHGLRWQPTSKDIQLTITSGNNVGWELAQLRVKAIDATNVTASVQLHTAAGAGTAFVAMAVRVKYATP